MMGVDLQTENVAKLIQLALERRTGLR